MGECPNNNDNLITMEKKITKGIIYLMTLTFILGALSQFRIIDDRDYPDDGYAIFHKDEKIAYIYLNPFDIEPIN